MHNPEDHQFFNKGVKIISHCLLCQTPYSPLQAQLLDEKDEARLIYVQCNKCQIAILASIMPGGLGMTSHYTVTDCTPDDILKFKDFSAISSDEVLSFHQSLQDGENVLENID